jgi:ABC-type uncharacterized transport system auxiliary subunit
MTRSRRLLAGAVLALGLAGCLFRAAEPPRFYRPASAALDGADDDGREAATASGAAIRLHAVRSAPFLRERMVWRASPVEYGLYEQRRWFELPSRYVRRALTTTLQDTPGLRLTSELAAARLDVEVLAFEEAFSPAHEAHVVLAAALRQGAETRLDRTFAAATPITGDDGAAVAEAMGRALDAVAREVAEAAARALAAAAPAGRGADGRRTERR